MQQFQVTAIEARTDNPGREAKLNQYRKQKRCYYEFDSCLRP